MADHAFWQECHRVYTNDKAGMEGVDKDLVKRTVYEMSKDSNHFKNEQRKQAQQMRRISRLKEIERTLTPERIQSLTKSLLIPRFPSFITVRKSDIQIKKLREKRDLSQIWLHVDMDAFFAAVEELHDPSLRGKPMAVGSKIMISTANYEARKYGVRSAMPGFIALKLCPDLVLVPGDFAKYRVASAKTRHVFRLYDPDFETGSLDEAYLNITDYTLVHSTSPGDVARELRELVTRETGLTCSVGIAPNCMLAKVASDINKPNGQFEIPADEEGIMEFLKTLPVRKVSGIGGVSEQTLKAFEIVTCGDLIEKRGLISALFYPSTAEFFLEIGLGIGRTVKHEEAEPGSICRKSMSCDRTFSPTNNPTILNQKIDELAKELSRHLRGEGLSGKTLTVKLKSQTFEVRTKAVTLKLAISTAEEIAIRAKEILESEMQHAPFRLMGVRLSHLEKAGKTKQSLITQFVSDGPSDDSAGECGHVAAKLSEI